NGGGLDLLALEGPEVQKPQLFLFGTLDLFERGSGLVPLAIEGGGAVEQLLVAREGVQHVALRFRREENLLIVLAMDVGQVGAEVAEERGGYRTAAEKGARFAASQNLALHQEFAIFDFHSRGLEQLANRGAVPDFERA